jgi:hypothetical protein
MKKYIFLWLLFVFLVDPAFSQSKPLDLSNVVLQLENYQQKVAKGQPNGYTPLNSLGLVPPEYIFPDFLTSTNGTFWVKGGNNTLIPLANNILNFDATSATINNIRIGLLSGSNYGISIRNDLSIPLVLSGGQNPNNRIYIANGNELGAANTNYTNFNWSIKSSGQFSLLDGVFRGSINLNGNNINEVNEIVSTSAPVGQSPSGIRIKLHSNQPEISSIGPDHTLRFSGSNFNIIIPSVLNIDTNYSVKSQYALNISTADGRYGKLSTTNTWPSTQTFNNISLVSPLGLEYGGLGVDITTNAGKATARSNLGLGNLQPRNDNLDSISTMVVPTSGSTFIVGIPSSQTFALKTRAETQQALAVTPGIDVQRQNNFLNIISNSSNSTVIGQKYFYILFGGATPTLNVRTSDQARIDLGMSTLGSSLVTQASQINIQSLLSLVPGVNIQSFSNALSQISANTWSGSTTITTVGNINSGFWNATPIIPLKGGTGLSVSPQAGQILVGAGNGTYQLTNSPSINSLTLTSNSTTVAPINISSTVKVGNLNSDLVDGIDLDSAFTGNKTFTDIDSKTHTIIIEKGIIKDWQTTE